MVDSALIFHWMINLLPYSPTPDKSPQAWLTPLPENKEHSQDHTNIGQRIEDDDILINPSDKSFLAITDHALQSYRQDKDKSGGQKGADQDQIQKGQISPGVGHTTIGGCASLEFLGRQAMGPLWARVC